MKPLDIETNRMAPGDYLAMVYDGEAPRADVLQSIPDLPPLALVRTDSKPLGPADLLCTARPVRFYGVPFAALPEGPWLLTRACVNMIDIYQVR
jgi:hypothetical protein